MEFPYIVRTNLVITGIANPRFCCDDPGIIDVDMTLADSVRGTVEINFSAHANDNEEHGRLVHAYALSLGPTPWVGATDEDKKKTIAAKRYEKEISGVVFGGMKIDSGRDSQGLITGATLASALDPSYVCYWKTPEGFVELNATMLAAVSQAVRAHVQACFNRERVLGEAVVAGTYTEAMLEEGWPTYE